MAASTLSGLKAGAARMAGSGIGVLAVIFLGVPVGRAFEPAFTGLVGVGGVAGRAGSIAAAGLVMVVVAVVFAGQVVRWFERRGRWNRRRDSAVGAAAGAVQGLALVFGLAWVLLCVPATTDRLGGGEPSVAEAGAVYERREWERTPVSGIVAAASERLAASGFGWAASASNPVAGARLVLLAQAFAEVSRDDAALRWFLDTPVMRDLRELKSYNTAVALASGDVQLTHFFTGEGVEIATLWEITSNDTILRILDETTILADLEPMAARIERAVHDARRMLASGILRPVSPGPRR
ncbi:MAG: hypothetical protein JNK70_06495 [Phycisphaerae bacterium]|nr:hypothetical protein [Phycisphaerae bacterium]